MASSDDSFQAVFRSEFRYVWRSLRRLGVPDRDIEDVAHELFLEVHRQWERYDKARPIRPWLFAFAVRAAADYRKQAYVRRRSWEEVPDAPSSGQNVEVLAERRRAWETVSEGLLALEPDRRAVFILSELDDVPMPEIASSLGIPLNTAYSRLRLARKDFTDAVKRVVARQRGTRLPLEGV